MPRISILQLFSKYLRYGGEEGSVARIGAAMQTHFDVESFVATTADLLEGSRSSLVCRAYNNNKVIKEITKKHKENKYEFWQIHNVFPAISPGIYTRAEELDVPIVHYLHNYRMGCVNGYLFTKGEECQKCLTGSYWHGAVGSCWRESMSQSAVMALMLADVRRRGLFQQVKQWIAISKQQKQIHIQMGIPEEKITVLEHYFEPQSSHKHGEPPGDGYALFIGRLSPEKGVGSLLDAWARVPSYRKLVIAGDGPDATALKLKAENLKLNNVKFVGFVASQDQYQLWDGAAFSIVPSVWQEPFGMVVLEAWARQRPVVANRIGALGEIISDGEDGFLSEPGDIESLSKTIEAAFSSDLAEMGSKGLSNLDSRYSKQRWLSEIRSVYSGLC
ncbi:MAG: glycosyltransferase family 4 protein [Luteolibacter sp.]